MACGGRKLLLSDSSRQDSLNEDDLFGEGQTNNASTEPHSETINESFEVENRLSNEGLIPNFHLLDSLSGSSTPSEKSDKSLDYRNELSDSFGDNRTPNFKEIYRRSLSACDRRKKFSEGADVEVFADPEMSTLVRKSNSLPDLVPTSSSSRSLSSSSFPDVTDNMEHSEPSFELQRSLEIKESLEGKSSVGKLAVGKDSFKRSVSINEQANEYIDNDDVERRSNSNKSSTDEQKERQKRWSKSSGYQTGESDTGSQENKTLMSQTSESGYSDMSWTSKDSDATGGTDSLPYNSRDEKFGECDKHGNLVNQALFEDLKSMKYNPDIEISESLEESYSLSKNSSSVESGSEKTINSSGSSLNTVVIGKQDDTPAILSHDELSHEKHVFHPLKSDECVAPLSGEGAIAPSPQSAGNMPTIIEDASFSIEPDKVKKVHEEEERQFKKVQKKFTSNSSVGSPMSDSLSPETPLSRDSHFYWVCFCL